jgi:Ca2+-binding EF-hand superfamily protein
MSPVGNAKPYFLLSARAREIFDRFDEDKSGALDKNEFTAFLFHLSPEETFTQEEINTAMKQLDKGQYLASHLNRFSCWTSSFLRHGIHHSLLLRR